MVKLPESDSRLSSYCRGMEAKLRDVRYLASLELPVLLIADFDTRFPSHRGEPALYRLSENTIFVNEAVFPDLISQAVLAHEIAHAADQRGLLTDGKYTGLTRSGSRIIAEILADVVASDWGFRDEIKKDRERHGSLYCAILEPSRDNEELQQRIRAYLARG